ncbi:MAG TPA: alpha/beta hydrolase-fold protein [Trebonia sp.]|nr:alpha/beta hydrolase-fold protein [Trebonia sp.]
MLEPDSGLLLALLITLSAALLAGAIRLRLLPFKIVCGVLSIVVAMTGGIATVNYYYGYYATWGAAWADFHGTSGGLGVISPAGTSVEAVSGRIGWTTFTGRLSGYNRRGLLYLPPQYGQAQYARVRFPVVELFHGTPGSPRVWSTVLEVSQLADRLIAEHLMGPMILVMPAINGPGYMDCVNGPTVKDDTYVTQDVRNDVLARYRASEDPYEWGMTGFSSGGYCAANLALRHRDSFGAAAVIEGYFRAADGPAANALQHNKQLELANSPLYTAEKLTANSGPLPAFWVAAGTQDRTDYQTATKFTAALDRLEQVPFFKLDAADNVRAWSAALPSALIWLWQQLAPPDLRVLFPVRAGISNSTGSLHVPPPKAKAHQTVTPEKAAGRH